MRKARCAGMQIATKPKSVMVAITPTKTKGSRGVASYTICANNWLATAPNSRPALEPENSRMSGRLKAERMS